MYDNLIISLVFIIIFGFYIYGMYAEIRYAKNTLYKGINNKDYIEVLCCLEVLKSSLSKKDFALGAKFLQGYSKKENKSKFIEEKIQKLLNKTQYY